MSVELQRKKQFIYPICHGDYIKRWMLTPLQEENYEAEPRPYPSDYRVNMPWAEALNPIREQFWAEKIFEKKEFTSRRIVSEADEASDDSSVLSVLWEDCWKPMKLYFPFETEKVDCSGFWKTPTLLTLGAALEIEVPKEGDYSFTLGICGGAKVFADGVLQAESYLYNRNEETETEIILHLQKGNHRLELLIHDLAERDTRFGFQLRYEGSETLYGKLPCRAEEEKLAEIQRLLEGVYVNRFNFSDDAIELFFENPVSEELEAFVEMAFVDAHTKAITKCKNIILQPGTEKVYIGDLLSRRTGMVQVTLQMRAGDVPMKRKLQFEYYDKHIMAEYSGKWLEKSLGDSSGAAVRAGKRTAADASAVSKRKQQALRFAADNGVNDLQRVFALRKLGEQQKQEALIKEIWDRELSCVRRREDCADFRLPAIIRAYLAPEFTEEEKREIKEILLDFRYWTDEPGNDVMWFFSENHALLFHAAQYLAGGLFEKEIFSNSGRTGAEQRKLGAERLHKWFCSFLTYGFNEWNSPVYIPIDMTGFFLLYDLAFDAEIRALAEKALEKAFSVFGENSFHGIVASSYGRIYFKNLIGRRIGEAAALNYIACGEGYLGQHTFATVNFALSSYEPSDEVMKLYQISVEGCESRRLEGEEQVRLYSYKTPDYIMGSVQSYHPGERGLQEHVLQVMIKDCDTQIWINHPGEAVYFGEGRPGYFAGNGTLPLVEQDKNKALITFRLLEQEVAYTHAFCPLNEFDSWQQDGKWIFLQKENIYAAIYADNGIQITENGPLRHYELVSPGRENVWKIVLENKESFLSFLHFKKFIITNGGKTL